MKRVIFAMLLVATISSLMSCEHVICVDDGAWDPIELDRNHVNFTQEGGQTVVTALNYPRWWISGGYDMEIGQGDYIYPTSSGGEDACTHDILEGSWFYISVPDKGKSNLVIITVDLHYDMKPRSAIVEMQAGNAFTRISITQN